MDNYQGGIAMKLLKKVSAVLLLATMSFSCTPLFSNSFGQTVLSYNRINILSGINNYECVPDCYTESGTLYVYLRDVANLLGLNYDISNNDTVITGKDTNEEYSFKITIGNRGALINNKYVLMDKAPIVGKDYKKRIYIPLESFVKAIGKTLTYDSATCTYMIGNKGQTVIRPNYTESKMTLIKKDGGVTTTKSVYTILIDDIPCVPIEALKELLSYDIAYYKDGKSVELITDSNHLIFAIGAYDVIQGNKSIFLPIVPFRYTSKYTNETNMYIPLTTSLVDTFQCSLKYDANTAFLTLKY